MLILTPNYLRNITDEIEFYFSHSSSFRRARQILVRLRKRWRACFTVRFSWAAFFSSRRAISCWLPRRFLARDCRANMPKKQRKYRVRVVVCVRASTDSLANAARKRGGAYALAHLVSCDLTVANLLFYGSHGRAIDSGAPPWATCLRHDTENREAVILSSLDSSFPLWVLRFFPSLKQRAS